jgi:hypothetical protein|tara:strand:+ start:100 stop:558 length:459 start_codon:yes stop_codon:yes gene_type:complete
MSNIINFPIKSGAFPILEQPNFLQELFGDDIVFTPEDQAYAEDRAYFDCIRADLGYDTIWDMGEGQLDMNKALFKDKPYLVTYSCIRDMGDDMDSATWVTFTAVTADGTIGELWKAAEACYQQAKAIVGDWHTFVEDFEMQDDGSLVMVTGS